MTSVRVKRGYTSLQDPIPDHTNGRERRSRSRSLVTAFTPQTARPPILNEPKFSQNDAQTRTRTPTVSDRDGDSHADPHRTSSLRRPSSRIWQHVMSSTRTPHAGLPQGPRTGFRPSRLISEDRDPFFPSNYITEEDQRSTRSLTGHRHQGGDLISLEGPQTDVLVPAGDHEPGRIGSALSLPRSEMSQFDWGDGEHHPDDIVEHLDVIDPQISTVATLTNAANAIVIPPLSFYSRKPVVVLPRRRRGKVSKSDSAEKGQEQGGDDDEDNLDFHVEDVLRKRDRFRRVMRGVWSFVQTPLGFITAIYGLLVVFWGTALVFFLARFIKCSNENSQDFWVELCQQIETGLFSITSIGLAPFRMVDTYRIYKIWWYHRRTGKLRQQAGLPELYDTNDLPDPHYDANYVPVLSDAEQVDLHYQQLSFMQSQTWYRPHGTQTHRAFPIDIAVWICVMNDLNTIFQILLSGCMWGMNRFQRPAWTTATTLPAAFVAGILAGYLIYWGSRKTKRVKEVTERLRMALAMEHLSSETEPERPTIATTGEGASRIPEAQPVGDSKRTLPSPLRNTQCKDFAADEEQTDGGETGAEIMVTPPTPITPTTPGIPIADEMTVPSADVLGGGQGNRR